MKNLNFLFMITLTLFSNSTFSAVASTPSDIPTRLAKNNFSMDFNAINHVLITDNNAPRLPSPGNTFIAKGFGVLNSPFVGMELTYDYHIAGTFIDVKDGKKLVFNHGTAISNVSNELHLYLDEATSSSAANENTASTYTDGVKLATFNVLPLSNEKGFFDTSNGTGADQITFKLSEHDKIRYGIDNNELFFKISSQLLLVDLTKEFPKAFNFGAFDHACGSLNNLFDSCDRETGKVSMTMAHAPIPASFWFFTTGLSTFSLVFKKKTGKEPYNS